MNIMCGYGSNVAVGAIITTDRYPERVLAIIDGVAGFDGQELKIYLTESAMGCELTDQTRYIPFGAFGRILGSDSSPREISAFLRTVAICWQKGGRNNDIFIPFHTQKTRRRILWPRPSWIL